MLPQWSRLPPPAWCRRRTRTLIPAAFPISPRFGEALDYAAQGKRGLNFHDPRGTLKRVYPY
jgi:fatty-acyl-CoA synthase